MRLSRQMVSLFITLVKIAESDFLLQAGGLAGGFCVFRHTGLP